LKNLVPVTRQTPDPTYRDERNVAQFLKMNTKYEENEEYGTFSMFLAE
jgi:hypothetical protein